MYLVKLAPVDNPICVLYNVKMEQYEQKCDYIPGKSTATKYACKCTEMGYITIKTKS